MLINCVVFQPANEEFLEKLGKTLRQSIYQTQLTIFPEPASTFLDELARLQAHFKPRNKDLFLIIRKQADFLTRGGFFDKTVTSHLEDNWDWTYPTQSIRSFFTRDNWQICTGETLHKVLQARLVSPEKILADKQFKINSRYLIDLPSIKYFRRYFQPRGTKDPNVDKNTYQFQYWNQRAKSYPDAGRTGYVGYYRQREMDFIKEYFLPGNVLDCGCGDGKFLESVKKIVNIPSFWVGFDFSPDMLKFANARAASFLQLDLKHLAFKKQSFDYVFALRSIKNLPGWQQQKQALLEIAQICKKRLVIIDSFSESYTQPIPGYNYLIKENKLIDVLEKMGLRLLEKRYYPEPARSFEFQSEPIGDEGFFVFER